MQEVSGVIKAAGVALEAEAFRQFGAAVQGATDRVLGGVFGFPDQPGEPVSPQIPGSASPQLNATAAVQQAEVGIWDSTRYAAQNTSRAMGSMADSPKLKFLFKISFSFFPDMIEYASTLNGTDLSDLMRSLDYSVKQIDLPTVEFDYEEVNMYNFRTKVLKQIRHREINLTFYDDVGNKALDFVNIYRMLHMPIARREQDPSGQLSESGFTFENDPNGMNTSWRGPLPGDRRNVLSKIIVHQYYMDLGSNEPVKVNDFVFTNPRISNLAISDQDHEIGGTPNFITCAFDFDSLFIDTGQSAAPDKHRRPPTAVMKHDILSDFDQGGAALYRGQQISPGKERNPFIDILARQGERIVQMGVSGAIRRAIGNNQAGRALSGAIGSISGALGTAANRTITSVGTGTFQGMALPSAPPVRDNTAPASQVANLTRQTRSNDLGDFLG
jgi:hypothetical protein